jgi:DNA-binding response OmpR family regulator
MPKVLIFESDAAFAQQLKDELQARACQVTVVDDASAGLQAAAAERPDLILLSVELPRMNGFSVCGKLKRDNNLKSVPLVIMSTDATEETFEQHRRLRTRAEEYVHKPISFAELQKHIVSYVTLDGASGLRASGGLDAGGNGASSDEVLIDDEVDFVDDEVELDEPVVEAAAPQSPDAVSEAAHCSMTTKPKPDRLRARSASTSLPRPSRPPSRSPRRPVRSAHRSTPAACNNNWRSPMPSWKRPTVA